MNNIVQTDVTPSSKIFNVLTQLQFLQFWNQKQNAQHTPSINISDDLVKAWSLDELLKCVRLPKDIPCSK